MSYFGDWKKTRKGRKAWKKGLKGEKKVARKTGGTRVGGPGKDDVIKGRGRYEVKYRKSPVTKPELRRMREKGTTRVYSKGGVYETRQAVRQEEKTED